MTGVAGWGIRRWMYANGLRSAEHLTLPDFLGIGAQKSGTSWLHENLRRHPQAFLPQVKEVHYFDERFPREPLEAYAGIFRGAAGRIKGEITPAYSILPRQRIAFIRAVMPGVRLVLMMRNPIERAWSHALMILVTQAGRRYEDVAPGEFYEHFASDANRRRGDYGSILDNWLSAFPAEQVFLGYFEDLQLRPMQLLRDVCAHIGLDTSIDFASLPYRQAVYAGPGISMPGQYFTFLSDLYRPAILALRRRLGRRVDEWLD